MRRIFLPLLALGACGQTVESSAPAANGGSAPVLDASGFETAAAFLSCLEGEAAIVSAHRGGPARGYPENAIETFEHTLAQIPALIETDVRETRDGVPVLLHDETVDRTTNGSGEIADMTLAEAKALYLLDEDGRATDFQIPTLDEALRAMRGKTILKLDVKRGVSLAKVVDAVAALSAEPHAAIITYNTNGAIIAAQADDDVTVIANVRGGDDLSELARRGLSQDRLVAWTGLIETPDDRLYELLGARDISTSGGALGQIDRAAERGDASGYAALEAAGLDIIATDRPLEAARLIGVDDVAQALQSCRG